MTLCHRRKCYVNRSNIKTEFELFFKKLLCNLSDMPKNKINKVKTKLRSTCEKYCHEKASYQKRKIISNLCNRKDLVI